MRVWAGGGGAPELDQAGIDVDEKASAFVKNSITPLEALEEAHP
jgi:hypothetical protein